MAVNKLKIKDVIKVLEVSIRENLDERNRRQGKMMGWDQLSYVFITIFYPTFCHMQGHPFDDYENIKLEAFNLLEVMMMDGPSKKSSNKIQKYIIQFIKIQRLDALG